ncbi:MAG: hypothetical protein JF606_19290 [Burkholderiales bacterium]|nr:hypothetical protein [Burkholderiales bacterium]
MHEHQRTHPALRDEPGCNHGLAECRRGGEHTAVVRQQLPCGLHLLGPQLAVKTYRIQRLAAAALVAQRRAHAEVVQRSKRIVQATAWQTKMLWVVLGAADDTRLPMHGQPHRLRPVELRG